jgi:hypothetical protein
MATTTNFGFNTPDDTAYVKDGASAMRTLGSNIDTRFGDVTNFPNQLVNVVSSISRPVAFSMQCGTGTTTVTGATITFATNRFTQAPLVTTNITGSSVGNTNQSVMGVGTVSTSSVVIYATSGGAQVAQAFAYHAVQMKSATAAG